MCNWRRLTPGRVNHDSDSAFCFLTADTFRHVISFTEFNTSIITMRGCWNICYTLTEWLWLKQALIFYYFFHLYYFKISESGKKYPSEATRGQRGFLQNACFFFHVIAQSQCLFYKDETEDSSKSSHLRCQMQKNQQLTNNQHCW